MIKDRKVTALIIHSLSIGGMERVMSMLANFFSEIDNIEVHLILFGKSSNIVYNINSQIIVHKPEIQSIRIRTLLTIHRMLFIRNKIKEIKPDAILSFGIHWNNFILLSLIGLSYPIFISDRGSPIRKYSFMHRIMRKILYKKAKGIIVQTNIAKQYMEKILPHSNIKIIGNPVRLIMNNKQLNIVRENIILSVGRLISTKNFDRLIYTFSKLEATGWRLIIVGGDSLRQNIYEDLRKLIYKLKLDEKVILAGECYNVEKYYLKSKIFAFTSSVEGFPNVIGEALSAGLPVVSYDCIAGPSEMIQDGVNGFLVPVFDDETFLQKLQLLIDDENLRSRMSINAVKSIERFSISNIGKEYLDFILS